MADSFRDAATSLMNAGEKGEHEYLPINFLLRHAIELYLKSVIVVLHRSLRLPYEEEPWDGEPTILHSGKPTKLRNLHSIGSLSRHATDTFLANLPTFEGKGPIDWSDAIPAEYETWVDAVERYDASGTFFRYPRTKHETADGEKSQFKVGDLDAALQKNEPGGPPVLAFAFVDDEHTVQEAFIRDPEALAGVRHALLKLADHLSSFADALRADIAGGW